jgi:hypothetical protein
MKKLNIKTGDRVFFKPEWMDPGDEKHTFIAMEDFSGDANSTEQLEVKCTTTGLFVDPYNSVQARMIERVESV